MPADETKLLGVALNSHQKRLLLGLAGDRCNAVFCGPALPNPRPTPVPEENWILDLAHDTARDRAQSKIAGRIKRSILHGQYNGYWHRFSRFASLVVATWNGSKGHRLLAMHAARAHRHRTLYLELAPLPGRLTVDFAGINHAGSLPRRGDFYRAWMEARPDMKDSNWRGERRELKARASSRPDIGQQPSPSGRDLSRERYVFCPLQVPGDTQLTLYGDWVRSSEHLISQLHVASYAIPTGWHLRIKEHPSSRAPSKALREFAGMRNSRIRIDNSTDTFEQVAHAAAVLTINSSVGFQAMFWDKPVIHLGHAFWGIEGLSTKAASTEDIANFLRTPGSLSFDAQLREAFMSYCIAHFPKESDVASGRVTLEDIIKRDTDRNAVLEGLLPNPDQSALRNVNGTQ